FGPGHTDPLLQLVVRPGIVPARRRHQDQRGDDLGMLDRQSLGDHASLREADEAGLPNSKILERGKPVFCEQRDRVGSVRLRAPPVPARVTRDDAILVGERLRHTAPEGVVPPEPMQEDERPAASSVHHEEPSPVGVDEPVAHRNRHTRAPSGSPQRATNSTSGASTRTWLRAAARARRVSRLRTASRIVVWRLAERASLRLSGKRSPIAAIEKRTCWKSIVSTGFLAAATSPAWKA